jgi:hypothetical protein
VVLLEQVDQVALQVLVEVLAVQDLLDQVVQAVQVVSLDLLDQAVHLDCLL